MCDPRQTDIGHCQFCMPSIQRASNGWIHSYQVLTVLRSTYYTYYGHALRFLQLLGKNPFRSTVDQLRGQVRRWLLINDSHSVLVFGSISIATFNSVVSCYIHKTKSKMATTALSYTPEPSEKVSNLHNIVTAVIFYQSR